MGAACLNQDDLVLAEVPVPLDDCAGMKFLAEDQEMLRAIGLRTDLQQELSAGSGYTLPRTAGAKLAFVLLQDGRLRTVTPSRGLSHKAEHTDSKTFERVGHLISSSRNRASGFRGWTSPADGPYSPQSRGEELRLLILPLAERECCSPFHGISSPCGNACVVSETEALSRILRNTHSRVSGAASLLERLSPAEALFRRRIEDAKDMKRFESLPLVGEMSGAIMIHHPSTWNHPRNQVLLRRGQRAEQDRQRQAVQKRPCEDEALMSLKPCQRQSSCEILRRDHLAEHASRGVGRRQQDRIQTELMRGDNLQVAKEGVAGSVAA